MIPQSPRKKKSTSNSLYEISNTQEYKKTDTGVNFALMTCFGCSTKWRIVSFFLSFAIPKR